MSSQAWAEGTVCRSAAVRASVTIGAVYVINARAVAALVRARVAPGRGRRADRASGWHDAVA
ncbi:hypothetical protein GCM10010216_72250 [Streptomyces flaveolus]|nr:hypothetical protein GCM10010216_72250 [Streptomyces flaveolus]